ncbi:hypothetical protein ACFFRL_11920 [Agromyces hippuratus]
MSEPVVVRPTGSVSRRRIMRAVLVLVGVALVVIAVVTWSMYLS